MLNITVEQFIKTYLTLSNLGLIKAKEFIYLDYVENENEQIEIVQTSKFLLGGFTNSKLLNAQVSSVYATQHNNTQIHLVLETFD
jgi:hypothetical protein